MYSSYTEAMLHVRNLPKQWLYLCNGRLCCVFSRVSKGGMGGCNHVVYESFPVTEKSDLHPKNRGRGPDFAFLPSLTCTVFLSSKDIIYRKYFDWLNFVRISSEDKRWFNRGWHFFQPMNSTDFANFLIQNISERYHWVDVTWIEMYYDNSYLFIRRNKR